MDNGEKAMMKPHYLVFDTETTGLFDFKLPADAPGQPRLASIAFITCDETGAEISRAKHFIKPDGWEMTADAGSINGLTTEFLKQHGVPVSAVLDDYCDMVSAGLIITAYNVQFDAKVMRAELRRAGRDDLFTVTKNSCLMRSLKPYGAEGLTMRGGSFVKLSVACEYFGRAQANAHDAMGDSEDAHFIMQRLLKDGRLLEPAVHYAKEKAL